jgi:hypothetical protein
LGDQGYCSVAREAEGEEELVGRDARPPPNGRARSAEQWISPRQDDGRNHPSPDTGEASRVGLGDAPRPCAQAVRACAEYLGDPTRLAAAERDW